jgi:hypothetical protein
VSITVSIRSHSVVVRLVSCISVLDLCMKAHAFLAGVILTLFVLWTHYLRTVDSQSVSLPVEEKNPSGRIEAFREESEPVQSMVAKRIGMHPHKCFPKVNMLNSGGDVIISLVFPEPTHAISELSEEIRIHMKGAIQHLRKLGLAFAVNDKYELVSQFVLSIGGFPVLASLQKVVPDRKDLGHQNLKLIDPTI